MEFKIAMVETQMHIGPDEESINLARAEKYIEEAADKGARIVCFPELFPGPWKDSNLYSPLERMQTKAAEKRVYVIFGDIEPTDDDENGFYNIFWFVGPDGEVVGKYRRTTPTGPWVYPYGDYWHFNYKTSDELPVFDIGDCKIGILMCSEVFCPELGRALALKGAEIIFYPAAIPGKQMYETWGSLIKARAIENNAYTAVCKNLLEDEKDGLLIVAGPEGTLYESGEPGVHVVSLDLDRLRFLRTHEDTFDTYQDTSFYRTKLGLLTPQWRRPEVFEEILGSGWKGV